MNRRLTALPIAALLLGSGCALVNDSGGRIAEVEKLATSIRDDVRSNAASSAVTRTRRARLAGEEIPLSPAAALPEVFARNISFATFGAQSLREVLETLSAETGVPIALRRTVSDGSASALSRNADTSVEEAAREVAIEYAGSLSGLLDTLAGRADLSWRYSARTRSVELFRYEIRVFPVHLMFGRRQIAGTVALGGSAGDGNSVSVSQNFALDPWTSMMSGIHAVLSRDDPTRFGGSDGVSSGTAQEAAGGGAGGSATTVMQVAGPGGSAIANTDLGLVTVTARPDMLQQIELYIDSINRRFSRNVLIDVQVYELTLSAQSSVGMNLELLYRRLSDVGVRIVGNPILEGESAVPSSMAISAPEGRNLAGSAAVVKALEQFGDVVLQTQAQVLAINGQPSPVQVANQVNYLASVSTTTTVDVGSVTSLNPGTQVVGFTGDFLPLILGDGRILLQYHISLSSLLALQEISSGSQKIQAPQVAHQTILQQAFVRDGESIVLFGFDQDRTSGKRARSFASVSGAADRSRHVTVVVMRVSGGQKHV